MNESLPVATASDADRSRALEAYKHVLTEIMAVPSEQAAPLDLDIEHVVNGVLTSVAPLRALRARIADELPKFDLARFDQLESLALAVEHANAVCVSCAAAGEGVAVLAEKVASMRDMLLSEAIALSNRGLIDGSRLDEVRTTSSYRQNAVDVLVLAQIFRSQIRTLDGKTSITLSDLESAVSLTDQLMETLSEQDRIGGTRKEADLIRQKAFALLCDAYRDARRAALYLEPDAADAFAPALFARASAPGFRHTEPAHLPLGVLPPAVATSPS